MTIRQSLLAEFTFEAQNTRKLFNAIPDQVLDYQPNDFNWTIAQLSSHIAELYNWWVLTLNQDVFDVGIYQYDKRDISSMNSIKQRLEENIAIAKAALENYPEERFFGMWSMEDKGKVVMPPMPRITVIRTFLMNHLYHHRGELIAYLRANGQPVPGLYGPSYEENMAARS